MLQLWPVERSVPRAGDDVLGGAQVWADEGRPGGGAGWGVGWSEPAGTWDSRAHASTARRGGRGYGGEGDLDVAGYEDAGDDEDEADGGDADPDPDADSDPDRDADSDPDAERVRAPGRGSRRAARSGDALTGSPLDRWRSARLDPGRRGVVALALVALVAAGLAAVVVLRGRPSEVVAPDVVVTGVPVPGGKVGAGSPPPNASAQVVVAVAGLVARPGLVTLPSGSRVADAVTAAGGALPGTDLGLLNLARKVVDGEQVLVGVAAPAGAPAGAGQAPAGAASGDGVVDLNAATAADLDGLPGIGPVLAQRIVDWRTENGPFGSVDQLREVGGIGESKFAQLKSKVKV